MKQIKVKKTIIFAIIAINLLSLCSIYYTKLKVKKIEEYTNCLEIIHDGLTLHELFEPSLPSVWSKNYWYEVEVYNKRYKEYKKQINEYKEKEQEYEDKINSIKNSFIDWGMIKDHFQRNIKRANHN